MRIVDSRQASASSASGLDAAGAVDLLGHAEGGIQFADAVLLHQLEAFGLLLGLGLASAR